MNYQQPIQTSKQLFLTNGHIHTIHIVFQIESFLNNPCHHVQSIHRHHGSTPPPAEDAPGQQSADQYVAAGLRHCARPCRNAKCWVKRGEPRKIGISPSKLTALFKKDRDLTK